MKRVIDLVVGRAFVITDLHGEWEPYVRYRDHFLTLRDQGQADILMFLGDVIHGYGPPERDYSLNILWDIIQLRQQLGPDAVIMLLGNHELPHIYGLTLSKGNISFTPRFEHALGEYRPYVIEFLDRLPFIIRTPAGVMLTHAGAAPGIATPETAPRLLDFSHQILLNEGDALLRRADVQELMGRYLEMDIARYDQMARDFLAVTGPEDPRYYHLLRGLIVSNFAEFLPLWDLLFTPCEIGLPEGMYERALENFLLAYAKSGCPQHALVTGHMPVEGGYAVVAGRQLRLASWAHANPKEAGCYLLFDVESPVRKASDLLPFVRPMP